MPRNLLILAIATLAVQSFAEPLNTELGGHVKARYVGQWFPDDSLFRTVAGRDSQDIESDLRLNLEADRAAWSLDGAWQLFALYGDRVEYSRDLPALGGLVLERLPNDDRRLLDMTWIVSDSGRQAVLHRIDRLSVGYTGANLVLRLGRQAITWGNGLIFSPMDIVNPFDPTTVDTEYKTGDDMLYAQYLLPNGHDLQAAWVARRNPATGGYENAESTLSIKYHGIVGQGEFDVLAARNHDDDTIGLGGNRSIGGAVWRGDLVVTDTGEVVRSQLATSISYSWTWGGRNVTGGIEYYYNGFGQPARDYDAIAENDELLSRLARGEIFTLGRYYLAGALTVELTPLWLLTPTVFANLDDGSAFLQLITQCSLGDNSLFLGSLNVPLGPPGSEFGGLETGTAGRYLSTDLGLFAQLAWYF